MKVVLGGWYESHAKILKNVLFGNISDADFLTHAVFYYHTEDSL